MARLELITNEGYTVKVMWECQFDESQIVERKPQLLTHPIVRHSPLYTRDALYGSRTEAMRLLYRIEENAETIQYCDIISLYPYICNFQIPQRTSDYSRRGHLQNRRLSSDGGTN